jgi:hypothetical protein
MFFYITPYDWLVLSGIAIVGVSFCLMFTPLRAR